MSEPLTAEIHVSITPSSGDQISLQQRFLGVRPFVLFELNDDTQQFDIEAGGGVDDLDTLKLIVGYMAEALGVGSGSADDEESPR